MSTAPWFWTRMHERSKMAAAPASNAATRELSLCDLNKDSSDHMRFGWCQQHHGFGLGCTNAAKRPLHPRPTRRHVSDAAACVLVPHRNFFFFFFRFPTRANLAQTRANLRRISPYRVNIGVFQLEKGNRLVRIRAEPLSSYLLLSGHKFFNLIFDFFFF